MRAVSGSLLVALGVVAGAAVLAAVLAGRLVMQDRALVQAAAQLAPGDRQVQVVWSGASNSFGRLNAFVAPRMRAVTGEQPSPRCSSARRRSRGAS